MRRFSVGGSKICYAPLSKSSISTFGNMAVVAKIKKQGKVVKVAIQPELPLSSTYHKALTRCYNGNGYEPPNNICSSITIQGLWHHKESRKV